MNSQTSVMTASEPTKFSRYRSVRRAVGPAAEPAPPLPQASSVLVNRAPSRYRRPTVTTGSDAPPLPSQSNYDIVLNTRNVAQTTPYATSVGSPPSSHQTSPPAQRYRRRPTQPVQPLPEAVELEQPPLPKPSRYHQRDLSRGASVAARPTTATSQRYDAAREEARLILEGEYDRLQRLKERQLQSNRELKAAQDAEAAREAKEAEKARIAQEVKAAQEAKLAQEAKEAEEIRIVQELKAAHEAKVAMRRRKPAAEEERSVPDAQARHKTEHFVDAPKQQVVRRPTTKGPRFITAPQNMIRDQAPKSRRSEDTRPMKVEAVFDAPVSAVNAGERRVEVRNNGASTGITLPVTPTTTSRDLLNSASIVMSDGVDPRSAILVECFSQVGLERPLRRYERVREVMNSWDSDNQNYLVIMAESDCAATGLEKSDAPENPPGEIEVQMFHSCKPGKWDKRWIMLRSDGQVTVSKRENDGEGANICHLSDFDVYAPTRKQTKTVKPPKKFCFAVKSQQKSSMFLEGTNFVHFFSTSDKRTADRWYTAVQSWRSWYLVNVLGEGKPVTQMNENGSSLLQLSGRPSTSQSNDVPYQLGTFQPLLDFNFDDMKFGEGQVSNTSKGHSSQPSKQSIDVGSLRVSTDHRRSNDLGPGGGLRRGSRSIRAPPTSFPSKLCAEARNKVDLGLSSDENAFTGTGLLARSASKRVDSGNASGGINGKPLVNLNEDSEFTDGSLLRQLQAWTATQGENEPKIDRQRRVEANIRVGEGLG